MPSGGAGPSLHAHMSKNADSSESRSIGVIGRPCSSVSGAPVSDNCLSAGRCGEPRMPMKSPASPGSPDSLPPITPGAEHAQREATHPPSAPPAPLPELPSLESRRVPCSPVQLARPATAPMEGGALHPPALYRSQSVLGLECRSVSSPPPRMLELSLSCGLTEPACRLPRLIPSSKPPRLALTERLADADGLAEPSSSTLPGPEPLFEEPARLGTESVARVVVELELEGFPPCGIELEWPVYSEGGRGGGGGSSSSSAPRTSSFSSCPSSSPISIAISSRLCSDSSCSADAAAARPPPTWPPPRTWLSR
mmetsp:Transcript_51320/g.133331  ORF Transcript_51320/g.133331 Transcript_51320/m.133331 type:complete len:310 (+) Transcript_51320:411-1340(+)